MNGLTLTWETLLLAVVLATVVYLLESALFSRRRRPGAAPEALRDLDLDVEGLHRRVQELEHALQDVREQIEACRSEWDAARQTLQEARRDAPQLRAEQGMPPPDTPYAQAVQLARRGVSPQELARRCGITNGEAELIVALNRAEP